MEKIFNNKKMLQLVSKWKIHLIVIGIISIIAGVFISSPIVITPKFKSTAIVYPTNISTYSKESETEQMFQIFLSTDIKFKMLNAFQLDKDYKLDRRDPLFITYFLDEYNNNVSIAKTEYESIKIEVQDKNPKVAAAMVNKLIEFYNQKVAELYRNKQKEMIDIMGDAMKTKEKEMDSIENLLTTMRLKYGILNYASQSSAATQGILQGNNKAKELYTNLAQFGGIYKNQDSLLCEARKQYINFKWLYENAVREYNKSITYAQVVTQPFPADKKSYPVRWVIVALTLAGGLIVSLIVIAIIESNKQKKSSTLESE